MNCAEARDRLLEADPAELEGRVDTELRRHLRACPDCQALADHVLNAQSALEAALDGIRPRAPVDAALEQATARATAARRLRKWWAAAPLAAAAGVAGLLLFGSGGSDMPGETWQPRSVETASGVHVEAPLGQDVVVFDIKDRPDVVVVWFFDKGDE